MISNEKKIISLTNNLTQCRRRRRPMPTRARVPEICWAIECRWIHWCGLAMNVTFAYRASSNKSPEKLLFVCTRSNLTLMYTLKLIRKKNEKKKTSEESSLLVILYYMWRVRGKPGIRQYLFFLIHTHQPNNNQIYTEGKYSIWYWWSRNAIGAEMLCVCVSYIYSMRLSARSRSHHSHTHSLMCSNHIVISVPKRRNIKLTRLSWIDQINLDRQFYLFICCLL